MNRGSENRVYLIWPRGLPSRHAETQREPVPRVDSGELDVALAFLSFARHCVLEKADGYLMSSCAAS